MIAGLVLGCECGAWQHGGEMSHEEALEADAAASTPGCTCPGYPGASRGLHDGFCDLFDPEEETAP